MTERVSRDWVYDHLICEFEHWDVCVKGLVGRDGERLFAEIVDETDDEITYALRPIAWTPECDEYLADYRTSYAHWFHEGKPRQLYDGRDLKWFADKWAGRNPIAEAAGTRRGERP